MKTIDINVPGYEIDTEKSDLKTGKIILKKTEKHYLTYQGVMKLLYADIKYLNVISDQGIIYSINPYNAGLTKGKAVNLNVSPKYKILAGAESLIMLANVALYVNKGWSRSQTNHGWVFQLDGKNRLKMFNVISDTRGSEIYFKDEEAIEEALHILGESTIREALNIGI